MQAKHIFNLFLKYFFEFIKMFDMGVQIFLDLNMHAHLNRYPMFCFPKQCMDIAASIHLRRGSGDIIAGHTNNGIGVPSNQRTIATTDCCNHRCIHSAYRKYALYLQ